jgi:hypothetical protein
MSSTLCTPVPTALMRRALYLLANPEAYSTLKAVESADAQRRLDELARECRSGTVRFLAATHFDGLCHGSALAVDGVALHREEEAVLRGSSAGNAGDGGAATMTKRTNQRPPA